jgi:hypothetical protein
MKVTCIHCGEPMHLAEFNELHERVGGGFYSWHTSCARDGLNQLLNNGRPMHLLGKPLDEYLKTLFDRDGGKPSPPSASNLS